MNRLARLIHGISSVIAPSNLDGEGGAKQEYLFWIDTLCCPISLAGKSIALQRIAAVYRKAAHVLVLDNSISPFSSAGDGPAKSAENCLRILGSATWMRRLWTLQGMLASPMYTTCNRMGLTLAMASCRGGFGEVNLFSVQGQGHKLGTGGWPPLSVGPV